MNTVPVFPIAIGGVPEFWGKLRSARVGFLALDYDGTVAPFHVSRMMARPMAGIPELIVQIRDRTNGAVAVISGRPLSELTRLLDIPGIMMVGSHGYEFRYPDGTLETRKPLYVQREGLYRALDAGFRRGLISRLEAKIAALALHTRGQPENEALSMEGWAMENWTPIALAHNLEVRRFNGGVELRCPGMDKGSALQIILSRQPDDAFSVYIGDDETDEDAFRFLKGRGIGIRVGHPDAPTSASGFLPDIQAVKDFLRGWAALAPEGLSGGVTWKREG